MSRILNFLVKHGTVPLIMAICATICFVFAKNLIAWFFILCVMLYVAAFVIRVVITHKVGAQTEIFSAYSNIRNVKYLIIGDMYKPFESGDMVQIAAPGRTLESCYEILRHTHSILEDNGTVIIAIKKKNIERVEYTVFDIPYFHRITLKRLGLNNSFSVLPIILHPFRSLAFLIGHKNSKYSLCDINADRIKRFCSERKYNLIFKLY